MSVRMLQRVLRVKQEQTISSNSGTKADEEGDEENDREGVSNPFDLLGPPDGTEEFEDWNVATESSSQNSLSSLVSSTKKKKKKSRNKGKVKAVTAKADGEDIDKLLDRLPFIDIGTTSTSMASVDMGTKWSTFGLAGILTVDPTYLRAENELKRIFGSKVINAVERSNGGVGNLRGMKVRQRISRRTNRGMPVRKTALVIPSEYWPRWDGSISMECTGAKDGLQFFKYAFSSSYMETQKKFEESGASYDPNTIATLLDHHPYHLESLLALAEVYRQLGEYQQSLGCLERCLFALECAWHPCFNPFQGTCRVPFSHEANRPFFFALFKHMQHLGRRGCHRSALEVCKLLLSIDSEDPLGALFCIDYFALRADQFEWLEDFAEHYNSESSITLLPNFSFSLAVARFYLEQQQLNQKILEGMKAQPSPHEKEGVSSHDLLKQALMLHPATLRKIIQKAPIREDAEWSRILKHTHFLKASPGGPSLEHLINLYVERNYLIWRVPDLQVWLKTVASVVVESSNEVKGEMENWACVRREAFQSTNNEYRHLHLSEFSDSAPTIPFEELQQMMRHGGGNEIMHAGGNIVHEGQGQDHDVLEGRNALLVFLQSLLPWTDYGVDLRGQDPQETRTEAADTDSEVEQ